MPEHPCAEGLSSACFKAYPAWARQALAYKLLHILLPKQLTKRLPGGLDRALIGPEATIPPGVVIPPGMAIPPNYTFPDRWVPWLYFNFLTGEPPWTLFPDGWKPGDPLPPGVTYPPGFVLPPGWTPEDHPPAALIPGYNPVPTPPISGAAPPLYIPPFSPGPIGGPTSGPSGSYLLYELLKDQNSPTDLFIFGDDETRWGFAATYDSIKHANAAWMLIRVGKVGNPTDTITIELRESAGYVDPGDIITGGISDPIAGANLPSSALDQEFIHFRFPNKPLINRIALNCFSLTRSGPPDPVNYYQVCVRPETGPYTWHQTYDGRWPSGVDAYPNYQLYGTSTEG